MALLNAIARTLIHIGTPAVNRLVSLLREGRDNEREMAAAAWVLGQMSAHGVDAVLRVTEDLVSILTDSSIEHTATVRHCAAAALAQFYLSPQISDSQRDSALSLGDTVLYTYVGKYTTKEVQSSRDWMTDRNWPEEVEVEHTEVEPRNLSFYVDEVMEYRRRALASLSVLGGDQLCCGSPMWEVSEQFDRMT